MESVMINKENIYRNVPEILKMTFDPYSVQILKESDIPSTDTLPEPDYVDLGLPSGTLWAKANLGALSETDYGKYYDYGSAGVEHLDQPAQYTGTENPLNINRDSASVILGTTWRTPSMDLIDELFNKTTVLFVTNYNNSGVNGVTCTGSNGNSIFIPASGSYSYDYQNNCPLYTELKNVGHNVLLWSSNPWSGTTGIGLAGEYFTNESFTQKYYEGVNPSYSSGLSIRPVKVKTFEEDRTLLLEFNTSVGAKVFVDLGLPSGLLWATTNVGAEYENGTGQYYQYGKGNKTWNQTHSEADYTGVENPLSSSKDTATQVWGQDFKTPTQAEFIELINNTTREYVTDYKGTGTDGLVFTGQNGNYIFLPAGGGKNSTGEDYSAGYGQYWSSTPYGTTWTDSAKSMAFYLGSWLHCEGYFSFRKEGCCIRPVMDVTQ